MHIVSTKRRYRTDICIICEISLNSQMILYRNRINIHAEKEALSALTDKIPDGTSPVTVHLNKRVKENLDKVKGTRSYAQVITELLEGKFDLEKEIQSLPVTEAVIQYRRGFKEARGRYARFGPCSKCHKEGFLWSDDRCSICHKKRNMPDYSYFRETDSAATVSDEDFEMAKVKLPNMERMVYQNGWRRGFDEGQFEGYGKAELEFKVTYPCSVCGKPIVMKPGSESHIAMKGYMREHGWEHSSCGNKT